MSKANIICYGEVLWDMLPSGKKPGGAPMNVAFHVQQLGTPSRMISRIGNDDLGSELIQFLNEKGIDTQLVQQDEALPTSTVEVTLDAKGTPSYEIIENVAWDNIQLTQKLQNEITETDAVIFGSLACRTAQSQQTLFDLLEATTLRIFDINLRPPFYSKALLERLLNYADIVKVNEEELDIVAEWLGSFDNEMDKIEAIKNEYNIDVIIITKGKDGVICIDNNEVFTHPIYPVDVADTVGSGDAFLAGFVHYFLKGELTPNCLKLASIMGALVASKSGATPTIKTEEIEELMYGQFVQEVA